MSGILENLFDRPKDEKFNTLNKFYDGDDKEGLPFKTDLTSREILDIIQIEFLNDWIKNNWNVDLKLKEYITTPYKKHTVSRNRQGRQEMVTVLKGALIEEEEKKRGSFRRIMGI